MRFGCRFDQKNEGGIRYERVELAASVRLSPLAVRVGRTRFDAVSLGTVLSPTTTHTVVKTLTRTEVQDDRQGNAPASVTAVLAKFAQGEGDTWKQTDSPDFRPPFIKSKLYQGTADQMGKTDHAYRSKTLFSSSHTRRPSPHPPLYR